MDIFQATGENNKEQEEIGFSETFENKIVIN